MTVRILRAITLCFLGLTLLAACADQYPPLPGLARDRPYRLDSGDKVRVIVYNDQSLTQEYGVGSDGTISLPIIGQVGARNSTIPELQQSIAQKLKKGVYASPGVSVEVTQYRPFYITGEVAKPGAYPFSGDLTVLSAVAVAGGFTVRADKDEMTVDRSRGFAVERYSAIPLSRIQPGDVIVVPEKIF